jgi:hypothetical protein
MAIYEGVKFDLKSILDNAPVLEVRAPYCRPFFENVKAEGIVFDTNPIVNNIPLVEVRTPYHMPIKHNQGVTSGFRFPPLGYKIKVLETGDN